jgi:methionine sulfoxide reductase catalytic subunit
MEPRSSEITPEWLWRAPGGQQGRRRWLQGAGAAVLGPMVGALPARADEPLVPNTLEQVSRYNNYYEFSSNKEVIWKLSEAFKPRPWTLEVGGEVERPRRWDLDELLQRFTQQDRTYRLRCVEGWSMVVPWRGFMLADLLQQAQPTSRAKFVEFVTVHRPAEMVGQRLPTLHWPYLEALRIDEAMHPLTLMVTGAYGQPLPNANGAPLRLAVPWKYGFKSGKAITTIRLVEQQPLTTWVRAAPAEYGFWGNVNPEVSHPRWSQRRELRLGESVKRPTLMFNGYAEQVASLYTGMDLRRHF